MIKRICSCCGFENEWLDEARSAGGKKGGAARVPKGFSNPEVKAKADATRLANRLKKAQANHAA